MLDRTNYILDIVNGRVDLYFLKDAIYSIGVYGLRPGQRVILFEMANTYISPPVYANEQGVAMINLCEIKQRDMCYYWQSTLADNLLNIPEGMPSPMYSWKVLYMNLDIQNPDPNQKDVVVEVNADARLS